MTETNTNKKKIHINLDDIKHVSPVKITPVNKQGIAITKSRRSSVGRVQQFPPFNITFTKDDTQHLNGVAVQVRGIQLLRVVIMKCFQQLQKNGYFGKTSQKTQKFFKEMRAAYLKTLDLMKQERLKTIDVQDIQMSRPNQDIFELFKSKYLNQMLLEQQQIFKLQQSFKDGSYKVKPQGKMIKQKKQQIQSLIFQTCSSLTLEQFQKRFMPIIQKHNDNEQRQFNEELMQVKRNLLHNMRAAQKMMELKMRLDNLQQRNKYDRSKQIQKKLKLRFGDNQINLFKLENLFL